jgi:hypothetical protein
MKFNLRDSVPIFNKNAPAATKLAALIFTISYCLSLHLLVNIIHAAHLVSVEHMPASPKISNNSLRGLMFFTVLVLAAWALLKGFLIAKLFYRRRWAKNALSGITLLVFIVIFWTHSMYPENVSLDLHNNLEHVAEVVAVVLLFTPGSMAWFRFRA